jgi:hypothetical protein
MLSNREQNDTFSSPAVKELKSLAKIYTIALYYNKYIWGAPPKGEIGKRQMHGHVKRSCTIWT